MPASEARLLANRANALKSTGPKTVEGKEASRANGYKHGLTGSGVVMPEAERAEVEALARALESELKPSGELGRILVRHAATMAVRMERCASLEMEAVAGRVRQAEADFVAPEGVAPTEADRLRSEAGRVAMFDSSKEAMLARKYEESARRGFFRAIQELRRAERAAKAPEVEAPKKPETLASFLPGAISSREFDRLLAEVAPAAPRMPVAKADRVDFSDLGGRFDVPIAIGKRR